ncbi:MAG: DUF2442 domain-containing protein [Ignavibacteriae bacterium]|nr:DUF2442 domain-containing protein [Ignavibacteriota bacterium]
MIPQVLHAKYLKDYTIWIQFKDGTEGEIDLRDELWGEMFEPLLNIEEFKKFRVDPELGTIVWDNGADLAPEFLYDNVNVPSEVF